MPEALEKITLVNESIKKENEEKLKEDYDIIIKKADNYFFFERLS